MFLVQFGIFVSNCAIVNMLNKTDLTDFYINAKSGVFPSKTSYLNELRDQT